MKEEQLTRLPKKLIFLLFNQLVNLYGRIFKISQYMLKLDLEVGHEGFNCQHLFRIYFGFHIDVLDCITISRIFNLIMVRNGMHLKLGM